MCFIFPTPYCLLLIFFSNFPRFVFQTFYTTFRIEQRTSCLGASTFITVMVNTVNLTRPRLIYDTSRAQVPNI